MKICGEKKNLSWGEKNQSMTTDTVITQMIDLIGKEIITAIITVIITVIIILYIH